MSSDWCTIESDPGVFTALIESFGVEGVELTELWSLDDDSLAQLGDTYGLIFLFKWEQQMEASDVREVLRDESLPEKLFFAKQVITNACATQAILSVLLNADVKRGDMLNNLKEFTMAFDPEMRGEAIGNSDQIKISHNSFGRTDADPFIRDHMKDDQNGEAFHFVAFVPFEGKVYELDGLKPGPIQVGSISDEEFSPTMSSWLMVARQAVQDRIERYAASEIKFNLMAMVQDKRIPIRNALENLPSDNETAMHLQEELLAEEQKRESWKKENERRKHNYIPFCLELLKAIAASGKLPEISKKANENYASKRSKTQRF